MLALGGSVFMASINAFEVISHFEGVAMSARSGVSSQSAEAVVGGGLQAIVPVRSTTNNTLAGSSADCTVDCAQVPRSSASAAEVAPCIAGLLGAPPLPSAAGAPPLVMPSAPPLPFGCTAPPLPAAEMASSGLPSSSPALEQANPTQHSTNHGACRITVCSSRSTAPCRYPCSFRPCPG
jgi:hypothetical protein